LETALAEELQGSEKDRRENEMITALLLRELEPFCDPGSARIEALCRLERHPTVQHLVSTVEGRLAPGRDPLDLLDGMFPPLSIAGKPRHRAMELIASIEGAPRGPYCGSLAWWSYAGSFDASVLIRTIVVEGERLHFSAGGGIVRGSSPTQEWEESLHKARSLLEAVGGER
jgi:para-aminobenzoate synthetase component 1